MLAMMKEHNIPIVVSSDSHTPKRVGADFDKGLKCLKEVGYDKVSHFKERKRIDLNIQDVRKINGFRYLISFTYNLLFKNSVIKL